MSCCLGSTIPGYGHSRNCLGTAGYYDEAQDTVVRKEDYRAKAFDLEVILGHIQPERDAYRALLEECLDWLCTHPSAHENLKEPWDGTYRLWCSDCHNYLRRMDDATLAMRVQAKLQEYKPK